MKTKILPLLGGLMFLCAPVFGAWATKELPVNRVGTSIAVTVSTSAWTKANTATSYISDRAGYRITNPATNNAAMYYVCHDAAPSEAITIKINEVAKGVNATAPCGPNLDLYLLSVHTSSETGYIWEIGQ